MKRIFVLLALCLIVCNSMAQDSIRVFLPKKGDIAFGVGLSPILNYAGNIFNGSTDNSIKNIGGEPITNGAKIDGFEIDDIVPDVSLMAKYMYTDKWAFRANIGLMLRTNTSKSYVIDDKDKFLDPFSEAKAIDKRSISKNGMSAMLGAEYRVGERRIQGLFGAGILFGFNKSKTKYTYGNELSALNQTPTMSDLAVTSGGYRTLIKKSDANVFFGISGSMGVECFVAPKISLGAEVSLSIYYVKGGQEYSLKEGYNKVTEKVEERYDLEKPGNTAFRMGTHNIGGSLYMAFYF